MQATRLEFEQRFWFLGAIFFAGFSCSWLDGTPASVGLVRLLAPQASDEQITRGVRTILAVAAAVMLIAAMLRTWATAYLRADIVHDQAMHSSHLVASGPYRRTRNPLYLGVILMAAGIGALAGRLGWAVIVVGVTLFLYRLILREEAGLLASQGDSFRAYMRKVPRLIPSLLPRVPADAATPRWGQALIGELFFWLLGLVMAFCAVTLDLHWCGLAFLAALPIYFVATIIAKKVARRPALPSPPH